MRLAAVLPLIVLAAALAGCASTPPESIELADTIGRDLGAVHAANRRLANLYFDRLAADIDRFVDEEYRPYVVRRSLEDLRLLELLRESMDGVGELDPLDLLTIYTEETVARIDSFRTALRAPVERQRAEVVERIDGAFQQLQAANAVVTGHLASVYEVRTARDELLQEMKLGGLGERLARDLARLSDGLQEVLEEGRRAEARLDEIPGRLRSVLGDDVP